jgi:hypothetical protein
MWTITNIYGTCNAKTTLDHRLLFSLLLVVVGGLGLAHAGYNVGVGRADITGPAAEVRPKLLTRHLPFYDERTVHRTTTVGIAFVFAISTIASDQSRASWAYYCLLYAEVANYRKRCYLHPALATI